MERTIRLVVLPATITIVLILILHRMAQLDEWTRQRTRGNEQLNLGPEFVLLAVLATVWTGVVVAWWVGRTRYGRHRRPPDKCEGCGYNLSGLIGRVRVCPECGKSMG